MRYAHRHLEKQVVLASRAFSSVVLTGPRRSGKTHLLRHLFPSADYRLLEDPETMQRVRQDPHGFLDGLTPPVILDEVQNTPEIFNYVRSRIDQHPNRKGQWFLTGSQEAGLMRNVTESMAGRAAILQLMPMSITESPRVSLLHGGYPEVLSRSKEASRWFSSYLQTYLERDVRQVTQVHDLATFRRFMGLLATRHGQVLNKSDLAAPLGMSVPGIGKWIDILEVTQQILVVQPHFDNLGKRLIKSPKIYFADSGLACHLLGIETEGELKRSPFLGALFEGFVAAEIAKAQINAGRRRQVYYFRDQQGLEVDFVVPTKSNGALLVEVKSTSTPTPKMAGPMLRLAKAFEDQKTLHGKIESKLVYRPSKNALKTRALSPGAQAVSIEELLTDYKP